MNYLLIGPDTPEAQLIDFEYAYWLATYGNATVYRVDPDVIYRERGMSGLEEHVLSLVHRHRIQVVFYGLGTEFDFRPVFLNQALANTFRVLILGDDEHYFDVSHRYYAQCFDFVLTTNPICDRYQLYGIEAHFLPTVYDASLFSRDPNTTVDIDVSFIGAMHGKAGRDSYAKALASAGIQVSLYGAGTPAGIVTKARVIEIYRRSRINLNFSGGNVTTPLTADTLINQRIRQVKGRCTKIVLCGGFLLSEYAPGTEKLFELANEIDVFRDEEELVEKARFYLAHEDIRAGMAARAHARALKSYDAAKFWPPVLRDINERASSGAQRKQRSLPIAFDKSFWSAFGAARFKYLVVFLFAGKPKLFLRELILLLRTGRFNGLAALWFMAAGLHSTRPNSRLADWTAEVAHQVRKSLRLW